MATVGERIKKLRKEKNLTLAQVAREQLSPAMVSLIENGKSKPSAENLEHIANVLDVSITELLGGINREELQKIINEITNKLENKLDLDTLHHVMEKIQDVLPKLGHNVESARVYELYGRCLYWVFIFYKKDFELLEDKNWETYFQKAEEIYSEFQLESKALGIQVRLAQIESTKGNYQKTIDMIDKNLESVRSTGSYDTISNIIRLKMLKIYCLEVLGQMEETFNLLHEVIDYSNKHMMLNNFFELHNIGAMLYYQENEHEKAREFVGKINKFFEIVQNESLYIEKELIMTHYMEFFEDRPEISLQMLSRLEEHTPSVAPYNEVVDQHFHNMVNDLRARCYTKLNEPNKALPLFRELLRDHDDGLDYSIREVNKSYQALCYMQIGDKENAEKFAKKSVSILKKYPRTAYYHFALNVLRDVQQMK